MDYTNLILLIRKGAVYALVILILLGLGQLWYTMSPPLFRDADIAETQMERAASLGDVDVLILGDSSGLMGVDAKQVSRLTSLNVQSLCTYATHGPEGFGTILGRFLDRGVKARVVLILMHPQPFKRPVAWRQTSETLAGWSRADEIIVPATERFPEGARKKILSLAQDVVPTNLLPLRWGNFYGTVDQMSCWIQKYNGSAFEATPVQEKPMKYGASELELAFSDEMLRSLVLLSAALQQYEGQVYVGLTPIPGVFESPGAAQWLREAQQIVISKLGLTKKNLLPLPSSISDAYFATQPNHGGMHIHHLNQSGAEFYSSLVADQLYKMRIYDFQLAGKRRAPAQTP